jgi:hypothetical protein
MTTKKGEERCIARGFHSWTRVVGPGYDGKNIHRCIDCGAEEVDEDLWSFSTKLEKTTEREYNGKP